jgi:hypothetical protein
MQAAYLIEEIPISRDVTIHGYQTRYRPINLEKFVLATQMCSEENPIGESRLE